MVVNKIRYQKDEELELGPKDRHENGLIRIFTDYGTMTFNDLHNSKFDIGGPSIKYERYADLKINEDVFIYKKPKTRYEILRGK